MDPGTLALREGHVSETANVAHDPGMAKTVILVSIFRKEAVNVDLRAGGSLRRIWAQCHELINGEQFDHICLFFSPGT